MIVIKIKKWTYLHFFSLIGMIFPLGSLDYYNAKEE